MKACPCGSGLAYTDCCKPLHDGLSPPSALALMRSRYSAYALGLVDYIQKTQQAPIDPKETQDFCQNTEFERLEILSFGEDWVHFIAHLKQNGKPFKLAEKSYFKKIHSHWVYVKGDFLTLNK